MNDRQLGSIFMAATDENHYNGDGLRAVAAAVWAETISELLTEFGIKRMMDGDLNPYSSSTQ